MSSRALVCSALSLALSCLVAGCSDDSSGGGSGATAAGVGSQGASGAAPTSAAAAAPTLPRLTVQGETFRDPQGRVVFLRGVNYSHRTKTAPHYSWQEEAHLAQVEDWGFNVVRYLILWELIEPQPGVYDTAYLDHIERVLDWAARHELYILLDMHQDLYAAPFGGEGAPAWATEDHLVDPNVLHQPWFLTYLTHEVRASFDRLYNDPTTRRHFARAWAEVAKRVEDHPHVLGYNVLNEPFSGNEMPWTVEQGALADFYDVVIDEVQKVDSDAVFFLEPVAMTTDFGIPTRLRWPQGVPAVYAPHFYDAFLADGVGGRYQGSWVPGVGLGVHAAQADGYGTPLFVGEWGVPSHRPDAFAAVRDQAATMDRMGVAGWTLWNHNPEPHVNAVLETEESHLLNTRTGPEHIAMDCYVRPYPRAVAGDPRDLSFDVATGELRLTIDNPDPQLATELYLPPRHYPGPPQVTAPGRSSYDAARHVLEYRAVPGQPNTIVVRP